MRKRWHELLVLPIKEKKATETKCRQCSDASKDCASEEKHPGFWREKGHEPAGRQRRDCSCMILCTYDFCSCMILCFPSRSRELTYLTTGLIKEDYWKSSDLVFLLLSKSGSSLSETSSSKPLICSIIHITHDVSCGCCFSDVRTLLSLHLFLFVKQFFPLPQLTLWSAGPKSTGLEGDLPAWQGFWSGSWSVRSHSHMALESAATGIPWASHSSPLLCGLGTGKHLVNFEDIFRKFCAQTWSLSASQWINCNSSELQFWLRRNCAVVKSVVRPGQITVIHKGLGDAVSSVSGMWINGVTSLIFIISTPLFSKKISGWLLAWQQPVTVPYRRLGFG